MVASTATRTGSVTVTAIPIWLEGEIHGHRAAALAQGDLIATAH